MDATSRPLVARTNDCLTIRYENVAGDWDSWVLLTADRHLDNKRSDRTLQRKHLELARERNAVVLDFGDLFDAMQGRDDRRGSKGSVIASVQSDKYFNAIVNDAAEFLSPYCDMFAMIAEGNHETAVRNRHEIDLRDCLIDLLKYKHGATMVQPGGYTGWVRFQFKISTKVRTIRLWYTHGSGGASPVTKGTIQSARRAEMIQNADIVVSGHSHNEYLMERPRKRLNEQGTEVCERQTHIQIPSYKPTGFGGSGSDWEDQKGLPPKLPGAWWVRFIHDATSSTIQHEEVAAH